MSYDRYIKELIIRNECIILPGFGGFETHYRPAMVTKDSGKIFPPSKKVVFRNDFKSDSGVLTDYIAQKEKSDTDTARQKLLAYIGELSARLESLGYAEIEGIGRLERAGGNIILCPVEEESYLIDSFGLTEVTMPLKEIKSEIQQFREVTPPKIGALVRPPLQKRRGKWLLWLIPLMLLALALCWYLGLFNSSERIKGPGSAEKKQAGYVFGRMEIISDSLQQVIDQRLDRDVQRQRALMYTEPVKSESQAGLEDGGKEASSAVAYRKEKMVDKHSAPYQLVAGSFKRESLAGAHALKLKRIGIEADVIKAGGGNYRVVVGYFTDKRQAQTQMEVLRNEYNMTVWVYHFLPE